MKVATNVAGVRPRFGALSSAIAMALAGLSSVSYVQAQEPAAPDEPLDEITVTGSRIVRQDFTANSPIQTVDEQLFDQTSAVGVETILNRLPQFVPAVTQFTTGDVQQTATNTVGASTVSLRGLGANRNLVLINGRRAMPVNPTMVVDTNSIPSARDPTRRSDLGRCLGRVRRGRRRRRRQLHPQGQLRGRFDRRPLRRHGARRRSDDRHLGALRRQRGRRPRQRHDGHRARHPDEAIRTGNATGASRIGRIRTRPAAASPSAARRGSTTSPSRTATEPELQVDEPASASNPRFIPSNHTPNPTFNPARHRRPPIRRPWPTTRRRPPSTRSFRRALARIRIRRPDASSRPTCSRRGSR